MFTQMRQPNDFSNGFTGQMTHQVPIGSFWNQHPVYRQQPVPFQAPVQNHSWNGYTPQGGYLQQGFHPFGHNYHPMYGQQNNPYMNQNYSQKDSQFIFQNPLQPKDEQIQKPYIPMNGYPVLNPYPKHSMIPKQKGGVQSIMNSFKSQDGSIDFNKMMNTAGQMMNAVTQVSSLVKGLGGIFKI